MTLIKNNYYIILSILLTLLVAMLTACGSTQQSADKYVYEDFKITEVSSDGEEIRGEKTEGSGEGIYLTKDYYNKFNDLKLKVGDKIKVKYNKKDYENEVWDNIVDIEEEM